MSLYPDTSTGRLCGLPVFTKCFTFADILNYRELDINPNLRIGIGTTKEKNVGKVNLLFDRNIAFDKSLFDYFSKMTGQNYTQDALDSLFDVTGFKEIIPFLDINEERINFSDLLKIPNNFFVTMNPENITFLGRKLNENQELINFSKQSRSIGYRLEVFLTYLRNFIGETNARLNYCLELKYPNLYSLNEHLILLTARNEINDETIAEVVKPFLKVEMI